MFSKRKFRVSLAALAALLAVLSITSLAWAGGWAVITLDRIPANVTAGQPYPLGFMVRQHGRTPWERDQLTIEARQVETGKSLTFEAKPDAIPGHYQATLLFPTAGAWEWQIQSGLFPEWQPMPGLQVTAAGAGTPATTPQAAGLPASLFGIAALAALAGGVVLLARSRARGQRALVGAGLLVLCAGLAFAFFSSANAAAFAAANGTAKSGPHPASSAVDAKAPSGQEVFLAKGCVVCHVNTRALKNAPEYSVNIGPDLSTYHQDPAFLRRWLADPNAIKPGTMMPALGLSQAEIEALIQFLNSK